MVNQDPWKHCVDPASMAERDFEILTALYDGEITYLDARIADVLGWFEESGILDQTTVIITADHGENVGHHGMMRHKYCLYDTLLHVPLIIHYPTGMAAPSRDTHQVQTLDLLPTVLAMLGDTSSGIYHSLQGYDLLSSSRRDSTIAKRARPDLTAIHKRLRGVDISKCDRALETTRTDRHGYVWSSDRNHELYDSQADPYEECNLIAEQPGIAEDLDQRLTEWLNSFEEAIASDRVPDFDEEVKSRLRALGYLE